MKEVRLRQCALCMSVVVFNTLLSTEGIDFPASFLTCKYGIVLNSLVSFESAQQKCEEYSSGLAMPKTIDDYQAIEKLFFSTAPTNQEMSLWLGATLSDKNGGEVLFLDETRISPIPYASGVPRWGRLYPQYNSSAKHVLLSSKLKYRPQDDFYRDRMFLVQEDNTELNGFVCEKPKNAHGLCGTNNPCENGATCTNVGCSAICSCSPGFSKPYCQKGPTCFPNPCSLRGRCVFDGSQRHCTCVPGIQESYCSKDFFQSVSMKFPECVYQMRYFGFIETYKDAKGHCEELNAELVTIKSEELQTLLFIDFFRTFFNKNNKVRFWLGAEKGGDGKYYWRDGTEVPENSVNSFPNWAANQPSNDVNKKYLMVSTDKELNPGFSPITHSFLTNDVNMANNKVTESVFRWTSANDGDVAGFVCEKKSSAFDPPCTDVLCQNDGICRNIGCYHKCECVLGFTGSNCEACTTGSSCQPSSCQNGGTCFQVGCTADTACNCPPTWGGDRCQTCLISNPCDKAPCSSGGKCIRISACSTTYTCECTSSTAGNNCNTCLLDPCAKNQCLNGATCKRKETCSNTFECECPPFYEGEFCDKGLFKPGEPPFQDCHYHINSALDTSAEGPQSAALKCELLNSSLAQIHNLTQQDFLINLILNNFEYHSEFYYWIGGTSVNGMLLWLDGTSIPLVNKNGYPKWGLTQPDVTNAKPNLVITNSLTFSSPSIDGRNSLVLAMFSQYYKLGFICERKNVSNPCYQFPCINGGRCAVTGCTYRCHCLKYYVGRHCEFSVPRLKSYSKREESLNSSYTFVCSVEGILIPHVTWKLKGNLLNDKFVDIKANKSLPFTIDNEYNGNTMTSTLKVHTIGYCFGGNTISCWASNNVKEDEVMQTFSISPGFYFLIQNSYYIFSTNSLYTHQEAVGECDKLGGYLATIPNENAQAYLEEIIDQYYANSTWENSDAWIGMYKNNNNSFALGNNQQISFANWDYDDTIQPQFDCSIISESYFWESRNCSNFTSRFICEIKDVGAPTILDISSPFGSGHISKIIIDWKFSSSMSKVVHQISAVSLRTVVVEVVPADVQSYNNQIETTLEGLDPEVDVEVKIEVAPPFCAIPLAATTSIRTAPCNTANISTEGENACLLTWEWPNSDLIKVWYFLINVTVQPSLIRSEKLSLLKTKIEKESFVANLSSHDRNYTFTALPNRDYDVEILGVLDTGEETYTFPKGTCFFEAEVPRLNEIPEIQSPLFGSPSFAFQPVDEKNGPVSCIFLMDIFFNSEVVYQLPAVNQEVLEQASNTSNNQPGIPFIYFAFPNPTNPVKFIIGDNKASSCNIFASSNIRQSRDVDSSDYYGINHPMVPNAFHNFFIVSSSPIESEVRFAVSPPYSYYASGDNIHIFKAVLAIVGSLLLSLGFGTLARTFGRRYFDKKKVENPLDWVDVPSEDFSEIFAKMKSSTILSETIKRVVLLGSQSDEIEEWKILITNEASGGTVAYAKLLKGSMMTPRQRQNIAIELKILKRIGQHNYVVQFFGISFDRTTEEFMIVLEFCPKRILLDLLVEARPKPGEYDSPTNTFNSLQLTKFCWQIAKGMQHIANLKIVHRTLAARNIVVTELLHCKIAGFESAREINQEEDIFRGQDMLVSKYDCRWMAPEGYFENVFSTASDIWSYGVLMWEIFSFGVTPYKELSGHFLELKILHQNYRLQAPGFCSDQMYAIMHNCWHTLPIFRGSFKEIKKNIELEMRLNHLFLSSRDLVGADSAKQILPEMSNTSFLDQPGTSLNGGGEEFNHHYVAKKKKNIAHTIQEIEVARNRMF